MYGDKMPSEHRRNGKPLCTPSQVAHGGPTLEGGMTWMIWGRGAKAVCGWWEAYNPGVEDVMLRAAHRKGNLIKPVSSLWLLAVASQVGEPGP